MVASERSIRRRDMYGWARRLDGFMIVRRYWESGITHRQPDGIAEPVSATLRPRRRMATHQARRHGGRRGRRRDREGEEPARQRCDQPVGVRSAQGQNARLAADVSLERLFRPAGADRRAALPHPAQPDRSEPALALGCGDDQRRRVRSRLVPRRQPDAPGRYERHAGGVTPTCGSRRRSSPPVPHTSAHDGHPVSRPNSHPFRKARIRAQRRHQRFPACAALLTPSTRPCSRDRRSTDSEALFYLALTFGLEDDPLARWNRPSASSRPPGGHGSRTRYDDLGFTTRALYACATPARRRSRHSRSRRLETVRALHPDTSGCSE